jgi:uncharacterized protein YdiU (UPF0061 family)
MLKLHLSMENTAARKGSGFLVEKEPPNDVHMPRDEVPASFTRAICTPLPKPQLVCISRAALALLETPPLATASLDALSKTEEERAWMHVIAGTGPLEGLGHCYAGHQFGHFSGQLGDGAAILLGGTSSKWEVQLKGAGLTAFSRTADGRKVERKCEMTTHACDVPHVMMVS